MCGRVMVKSTKRQRDEIRKCHAGVGFLVYHEGNGVSVETEFFINRKTKQPCYISNGKPLEFDITGDD